MKRVVYSRQRRAGPLGVVHVPKSAGTAVSEALGQVSGCYVGPGYYDVAHFGRQDLFDGVPIETRPVLVSEERLRRLCAEHPLVMGHYAASSLLRAGCAGLAVQVREPRSRLLSLYRFWGSQPPPVRAEWGLWGSQVVDAADLPLGAFLRHHATWPAADNAIARQLLAARAPRHNAIPRRQLRWALVSGSYRRLRSALRIVEWDARAVDFVERVCQELGAEVVPIQRANVTPVASSVHEIDADTLAALDACTRLDRLTLDRLMEDGLLRRLSPEELTADFTTTAERLGFRLRARPH